jgi:multidrug efflux pump
MGVVVIAFAVALLGFLQVPQQFLPSSDRLEVLIDMRLPEGASFAATASDVTRMGEILAKDQGVRSWAVYIGTGSPRFFLTSSLQLDSANYAQFVINTKSISAREALVHNLRTFAGNSRGWWFFRCPDAELPIGTRP